MPQTLSADLDHLVARIQARLQAHLQPSESPAPIPNWPAVQPDDTSHWAALLRRHQLTDDERCILLIALAPHIRPQVLDIFPSLRQTQHQPFAEFGGQMGQQHHGFLPTGETALFILTGNDLAARFEVMHMLAPSGKLVGLGFIQLDAVREGEPEMAGLLRPTAELLDTVTSGERKAPRFGPGFPARHVETQLQWSDLVLPAKCMRQIEEIRTWMGVSQTVMHEWGMKGRLAPGYKVLFYGPPGTGKTFTAKLLGRATGVPVFRIDLSTVVSKYIGETEKNLERVFQQAERQGWILFFDEADALFGKRTRVSDAHDRYANQEVSYLLQRLEEYDGTVILATNDKDSIDDAFTRRFQAMVQFPMPSPEERLRIWKQGIPPALTVESEAAMEAIARRYEFAGGHIMNVIRYAAMKAAARGEAILRTADIEAGLQQELHKSGRLLH
ncbi:MAG: AAA family ATPase [Bacteroidia bacterium]